MTLPSALSWVCAAGRPLIVSCRVLADTGTLVALSSARAPSIGSVPWLATPRTIATTSLSGATAMTLCGVVSSSQFGGNCMNTLASG